MCGRLLWSCVFNCLLFAQSSFAALLSTGLALLLSSHSQLVSCLPVAFTTKDIEIFYAFIVFRMCNYKILYLLYYTCILMFFNFNL